jgi:polysaccharide chain length determinant protein (PEP-CTERM system associated)
MDGLVEKLIHEMRGLWRFRRIGLVSAWIVCLLGWIVVYAIPESYEAHARVNVDTRTALRPLLQGLAVDQDVESQLTMVRQALLGRNNLEKVARTVGLDVTATTPAERERLLASLTERIVIALEPPATRDPRVPNNFYRITYTDESRERALQVVDVLLNSFVEDALGSERSGTATAQIFLREQLVEYERRLAEAEARLADFKKQNVGMVPGADGQGGYFQRLQTEMAEVRRIESEMAVATSRRAELLRQLRGETPFVPPSDTSAGGARASGGQPSQDTATRIQETRARLDDLLLRFTDKHPDVTATKETLQQLLDRQQAEIAALKRGDLGAAAVAGASSNPVYQGIQVQMNQTDVEIAALRGQLADHQRNVSQLRKLVDTVPEVEAQYARLTRDYDATKVQYNALFERLGRARLSEDAEETGVVRFDVVDPPTASFQPIFPNRPLFLAGVLVAGLAAGVGMAYLVHMFKPVFVNGNALAELTGVPVLGVISRMWLEKERAEVRSGLVRYAGACVLLLLLFFVVLAVEQPASRYLREIL